MRNYMTKITLLGTSCMVPTKTRNVSGYALEINGKILLFDCGEGTQRQMSIAKLSRAKVYQIYLSHWHADHFAGLLGLIQTIDDSNAKLELFGPIETKKRLELLLSSGYYYQQIKITVHEIAPTKIPVEIYSCKDYSIHAISLHHTVPCIGFSFCETNKRRVLMSKIQELGIKTGPHIAELVKGKTIKISNKTISPDDVTKVIKGKKFTYVADSLFCEEAILLAKQSDVVICESTYESDHSEHAKKYCHMTSVQAATIARDSDSKKLLLTHISQRYKSTETMLNQAKTIFTHTAVGEDLQSFKL